MIKGVVNYIKCKWRRHMIKGNVMYHQVQGMETSYDKGS